MGHFSAKTLTPPGSDLNATQQAGGYVVGLDDGIARQMQAASSLEAEARTSGPEAVGLWAQLMHDNDVRSAMTACQKAITLIGGRRSCSLPIWLDSPPAPARS